MPPLGEVARVYADSPQNNLPTLNSVNTRAQFMYENTQGLRVTLYVAVFEPGQAPDSTSFRSARVGDEEAFYWIEDRFGYALSGNVNGPDMQALAREVYGQLER